LPIVLKPGCVLGSVHPCLITKDIEVGEEHERQTPVNCKHQTKFVLKALRVTHQNCSQYALILWVIKSIQTH